MVTDEHSRGQVILIGAIALAFIILGVVVVFNGVLYTETISSSSTSQGTSDADVFEQNLEMTIVGLAHRGNTNGGWTSGEFETAINDDDGLGDQFQRTKSNSRSVAVSIDAVDVTHGTVFLGDSLNTEPEPQGERIGHFEIEVQNPNDDVTINATRNAEHDELTLKGEGNSYSLEDTTCEIDDSVARIDLLTGSVNATTINDCSDLALIDPNEEYDDINITIAGGSNMGEYDFVRLDSGEDVVSVTVDVTYDSSDVSYKKEEKEISVYGGNR